MFNNHPISDDSCHPLLDDLLHCIHFWMIHAIHYWMIYYTVIKHPFLDVILVISRYAQPFSVLGGTVVRPGARVLTSAESLHLLKAKEVQMKKGTGKKEQQKLVP